MDHEIFFSLCIDYIVFGHGKDSVIACEWVCVYMSEQIQWTGILLVEKLLRNDQSI